MTKYYKVLKDTPLFEAGAILKYDDQDDSYYSGISDLWNRNEKLEGKIHFREDILTVEKSPDFYERVYKFGSTKNASFVSREEAKKQASGTVAAKKS